MNVDNVRSQMRKGMLEYCILLLLHKEPSYASDIIQRLKEARLIVVEGTLYPLLTRLKNDDLLSYEWVESTQGPPRKYYNLTPQGEIFLTQHTCSRIAQTSVQPLSFHLSIHQPTNMITVTFILRVYDP